MSRCRTSPARESSGLSGDRASGEELPIVAACLQQTDGFLSCNVFGESGLLACAAVHNTFKPSEHCSKTQAHAHSLLLGVSCVVLVDSIW